MAQLSQNLHAPNDDRDLLRARIEHALTSLLNQWSDLPNLANEWEEWGEMERFDFYLEWPIQEDNLHLLQQWHDQGLLTPIQCERYAELQRLMEQNAPILERLLAA